MIILQILPNATSVYMDSKAFLIPQTGYVNKNPHCLYSAGFCFFGDTILSDSQQIVFTLSSFLFLPAYFLLLSTLMRVSRLATSHAV